MEWQSFSSVLSVSLSARCTAHVHVNTQFSLFFPLKAAIVSIFVSTVDHMTVCTRKWFLVVMPAQRIIRLGSFPMQSFIAYFSSLFWFYGLQLYCFGSLSPLSSVLFPDVTSCWFIFLAKEFEQPTVNYLLSTTRQTKLATSW